MVVTVRTKERLEKHYDYLTKKGNVWSTRTSPVFGSGPKEPVSYDQTGLPKIIEWLVFLRPL